MFQQDGHNIQRLQVIVEPGTPIGFKIVRTARMMIAELQDPTNPHSPTLQAPVSCRESKVTVVIYQF
jgi:ribosomal protein RSM22 (predicted rRNA methylase)